MESENGTSVLVRFSDELAAAVEGVGGGVVTVHARRRMPASGIVWSEDGLIVTANHVVERDEEITVGLADGRELEATLVGRDPGSDLALLQAKGSGLTVAPKAEVPAKIGHFVLAVGRPGPSGPMASHGVVSAVGGPWRTGHGTTVEGYIQADVAMLPGFSGGPLVDAAGGVLGLNSSTLGRGGGLTVPLAAIDQVVGALRTHGKVRRGYLGISTHTVRLSPAVAQAAGTEQEQGLMIMSVEPDSPAEQGGLLLGDIVIALDGEAVAEVEELQDRLSGERVGRQVPVRVIRAGAPLEVKVTVGERG
jgi:S1-C subfamily serine protease